MYAGLIYRYEPEGLSPLPAWTHYFTIDMGSGRTICGPLLRCRVNDKIWESGYKIDKEHLSYKKLPDDSYLLRSGPVIGTYTRFGSGQGGADPTVRMKMFHLGRKGTINNILEVELALNFIDLTDEDIQFSSDWRNITVYRRKEEDWSSTRYCLKDDRYEVCSTGFSRPPPGPRHVKFE